MKTYQLILCLIWLHSFVEAGIFLQAKNAEIIQDTVWLYPNSTLIQSDMPSPHIFDVVYPFDHVPLAHLNGTTAGILYHKADPCSSLIQLNISSIALMKKKEGGDCSLTERILNAQMEGALGVIVYDAIQENNPAEGVSLIDKHIKIPAYNVDANLGAQLEKIVSLPQTNTSRIAVVRVTLIPARNTHATAWELTLLVMIVILGTSVIFSVAMHIYMWKKGQQLQQSVERHPIQPNLRDLLPMGKPLIDLSRLHTFPTRTVDCLPTTQDDRKQDTLALGTWRKTLFKKHSIVHIHHASQNNVCVVCLEAFKIGDQLRELPCHHEYHCVCIDPWLTSKSGECPICKFDCSLDNQHGQKELAVMSHWFELFMPLAMFRSRKIGQAVELPISTPVITIEQQNRSLASPSHTETTVQPQEARGSTSTEIQGAENVLQQQQQQQQEEDQTINLRNSVVSLQGTNRQSILSIRQSMFISRQDPEPSPTHELMSTLDIGQLPQIDVSSFHSLDLENIMKECLDKTPNTYF
ncbi:uncharacterized protein B0P05DRAFT_565678 [Gilbertella persicaria]|uniref:uncharacterized protein n=1 Tax=Gilbertella persicaria TaxID=101096 RepID=UPI00221FC131|nr:uncharacterized protein B0P05DRAFT_565678 [Gilbertella persicaria]KAI8047579.1 hypothetical protein B0P05DRAFT_565678 [Gilbertella persicaria]